jgi:hypothetical protein
MRLLVQSAMIFFGTLMIAGLLALGTPAVLDATLDVASAPAHAPHAQVARPVAPVTSLQRRADIRWAVQMAALQNQR